jgi:hypothetical protein
MTNLNIAKIETIVASKTIKGTSFVGVRNYTNSKGEISNQTFIVGINYAKLLENDLNTLTNFDLNPILKKYPTERLTVLKAYNELLTSLVKRTATEKEKDELRAKNDLTIKQSDAQSDAYIQIGKGLKSKDNDLYLFGLLVKKTVLKSVEYPTVNSQLKTIIKNDIKKQSDLRDLKVRNFKLGALETLKMQGFTIEQ